MSDEEWDVLASLIPPAKAGGHPRPTHIREVINAILYLDRTGSPMESLAARLFRLYDRVELLPHLAQ